ncbi:MAG: hypothetical protein AABY83_15105 [Pseudomonadota bacterium]
MHTAQVKKVTHIAIASAALLLFVAQPTARAELPAPVHAKVEQYKKKLVTWATDPVVVKAAQEANAKEGGLEPGMTNSKWDDLAEHDAKVTRFQTSGAGKLLTKLEQDKGISKLYLRDTKGNLVASGTNKPLIFNNSTKPPFINGMKGVWAAGEVKPDPTSQVKGVHVAVPVVDGGKIIGVLHTSVVAD